MADRHLQAVLSYIHKRTKPRIASTLADGDLLNRFVAHGDQAAFTALV
jgi:hypothetical protein